MVAFGAFLVYIVPYWHPTNIFAGAVLFAGMSIIAIAIGKFLSGEGDKVWLLLIGVVVALEAVFFVVF